MTWLDLAVLGVLAVSALLAFMRGLVREVLGVGAWAGAAAFAVWGLPTVRPLLTSRLPAEWIDIAGAGGLFLVSLIVLLMVSHYVSRAVRASALGGVDRSLGLVFGLARGAALVVIAYIVGQWVLPVERWPAPVLEARSLPLAYDGAIWARDRLPENYRPKIEPPPASREATADALLRATPVGRATGKPSARE
jgi:membrane protein required for colicin V production